MWSEISRSYSFIKGFMSYGPFRRLKCFYYYFLIEYLWLCLFGHNGHICSTTVTSGFSYENHTATVCIYCSSCDMLLDSFCVWHFEPHLHHKFVQLFLLFELTINIQVMHIYFMFVSEDRIVISWFCEIKMIRYDQL